MIREEPGCRSPPFERFNKPIIITGFGADTYSDLRTNEAEIFTDEFQTKFIPQS